MDDSHCTNLDGVCGPFQRAYIVRKELKNIAPSVVVSKVQALASTYMAAFVSQTAVGCGAQCRRTRSARRERAMAYAAEDEATMFAKIFSLPPLNLKPLTSEQDVVVRGALRSSVTVAGAGSGKTQTLLRMFLHLSVQLPGRNVIVTSFSNAAAEEFGRRMAETWPSVENLPKKSWEAWKKRHLRTLHSFARNEICRQFGETEARRNRMVTAATRTLRHKAHEPSVEEWVGNLTLLVDEAQDCNTEQLELLGELEHMGATVHLVGDPRQAIYAFQGAEPHGILEKGRSWRVTNHLSTNFRSSPQIVDVLNLLIQGPYSSITQLENMPAQRAHEDNTPGPLPKLYHCKSMFEDGLKASPLYEELRSGLRDTASKQLAILVRRNADVDRIHQALFVAGFDCLARASRARIGEEQAALPASTDVSTIVQVESYHVSKGQQFDRVWVVVQGFGSAEQARADAAAKDDKARLEDLRLLYVAFSRAKTHLSIVVLQAHPPLWLEEMLRNPVAAQLLNRQSAPKHWKELPPTAPSKPEPRWSVGRLVNDRDGADGLLSHTRRGQRYLGGQRDIEDETRHGAEQIGCLSDERKDLMARGIEEPAQQLALQGVATVYHNLVELSAVGQFCGLAEHWSRVENALGRLALIPLREGIEGKRLLDLAEKTHRADFMEGLARHIAEALAAVDPARHNWNDTRLYLNSAERACQFQGEVSGALCREFCDLLLSRAHEGAYCLGARDDATTCAVREHLAEVLRTRVLRPRDDEPVHVAVKRAYDLIFRDRVAVVDAKSSMRTRLCLLEGAQKSTARTGAANADDAIPKVVSGGNAILSRLFSDRGAVDADKTDAARRPVPYLGSEHIGLRLDIKDCCLSTSTHAALSMQCERFKDFLHERFHTREEIAQALAGNHTYQEWKPATFDPEGINAVQTVFGIHALYIGGAEGGTVIDVQAKAELSVEDETRVLLYGALNPGAKRAILWDTRRARLYVYHLDRGEADELLYAALAGQQGEASAWRVDDSETEAAVTPPSLLSPLWNAKRRRLPNDEVDARSIDSVA